MRSLFKVAYRDIVSDKKRTLLMFANIILAVSLVTFIFSLTSGIEDSLSKFRYESSPTYNLELSGVKNPQQILENQKDVETAIILSSVGELVIEGKGPGAGGYYNIANFSNEVLSEYELVSGKFSSSENEIAVSESVRKNALNDNEVLEIGKVIQVINPDGTLRDVTIVGFFSGFRDHIWGAQMLSSVVSDKNTMLITYENDSTNYKENLNMIKSEIDDILIFENTDRNNYLGFTNYTEPISYLIMLFGVTLLTIIGYSSSLMIYNTVKLNIEIKIHSYSLFRNIGATKKQVRIALMTEMFVLTILASALGLLIGFLTAKYGMNAIKPLFSTGIGFEEGLKEVMMPSISIKIIMLVIFVSSLTVLIPTFLVTRKMFKLTSIQVINEKRNISQKRFENSNLLSFLFKYPGVLALKNFRRDGGKYRIIRRSLVVMMITVVCASSFSKSAIDNAMSFIPESEYVITVTSNEIIPELENVLSDNISRITQYRELVTELTDNKVTVNNFKKGIGESKTNYIWVFDSTNYSKVVEELDLEGITNDEIIIMDFYKGISIEYADMPQNNIFNGRQTDLESNEVIEINRILYDETEGETLENIGSFTIKTVISKLPFGLAFKNYPSVITIVSEEQETMFSYPAQRSSYLYQIESDYPSEVQEILESYLKDNKYYFEIENRALLKESHLELYNSIIKLNSLIMGLVGLVSIISIINVTSQDMERRKGEFATLESIGMTKGQVVKMILLESFLNIIFSVALGFFLSVCITYGGYALFGKSIYLVNFKIDIKMLLISAASFGLVFIVQIFNSIGQYRKMTIIEVIKNESK